MEKLNFLGVGPRIAGFLLPYLAVMIVLNSLFPELFTFGPGAKSVLLIVGIVWLAVGLISYVITARLLLEGLRNTKLITRGTFALCRNPLYATLILMIFPGLALVLNSWLVLTTSVIGYVVFKAFIKSEYDEMQKFFGEAWQEYERKTSEFFPFLK